MKRFMSLILCLILVFSVLTVYGTGDTEISTKETYIPENAETYKGHQYKIFIENISWPEAKIACEKQGGHLATITSSDEQAFIEKLNSNEDSLWIGGHRINKNDWYWVTGEPWQYTHWADGEPNDSDNVMSNENCVAVWPLEWNDLNENNTYETNGYICEWEGKEAREPSVTTGEASNIKSDSAKVSFTIKDPGDYSINDAGILYGYSKKDTKKKSYGTTGSKKGNFSVTVSGLNGGKKIYFRAYATYKDGTVYGEWKSFTTKNHEVTVDGCVYQLIDNTAVFIKPVNKKTKELHIPESISYEGKKYKVTKIADAACKKMTSLESLTIEVPMFAIGKEAFYGCSKLESIVIKAPSLKLGQAAFEGISKDVKIEVPKAALNAYKRELWKAGVPKDARFYSPGEKPEVLYRGTFKEKSKTIYTGDSWKIAGSVYSKDGNLNWLTIYSKDWGKDDWKYALKYAKNFTKDKITSLNLDKYYTINAGAAPWNKPGTYKLKLMAAEQDLKNSPITLDEMTIEIKKRSFTWPAEGKTVNVLNYYDTFNSHGKHGKGYAIDILGKYGSKIYAAWEGKIKHLTHVSYGTYIEITHPDGSKTLYAHLSGWNKKWKDGDTVKAGDVIGYMGSSGKNVTGTHLHFEWFVKDSKGEWQGKNFWTMFYKNKKDLVYTNTLYKANKYYYGKKKQCTEVVDWLEKHFKKNKNGLWVWNK